MAKVGDEYFFAADSPVEGAAEQVEIVTELPEGVTIEELALSVLKTSLKETAEEIRVFFGWDE